MNSKLGSSDRRKRIALAVLAVVLGIVAAVASAELLCRVFHGDRYRHSSQNFFPPRSVIYDPDVGWAYRPGYQGVWEFLEYRHTVKINALGLRDDEIGPKTCPRILFIGDSFVFGLGVERADTFVKGVEDRLNRSGPVVECINGGRIGSAGQVYRHYARKYVPLLAPDLVVLCPFSENDVFETAVFADTNPAIYENRDGEVYVGGRPLARERHFGEGPVFRASALYRFLRLNVGHFSIYRNRQVARSEWFDPYLRDAPDRIKRASMLLLECFDEIAEVCSERDSAFALVLIPSNVDSSPRLWKRMIGRTEEGAAAYDRDKPFRTFGDHAGRRGWPVLNLKPAFEAGHPDRLYYRHDRHFNAAGHRLAADEIAKFLMSEPVLLAAPGSGAGPQGQESEELH